MFPPQRAAVCELRPFSCLAPGPRVQLRRRSPALLGRHTENVTAGPASVPLSGSSSISRLPEAVPSVPSLSAQSPGGEGELSKPAQTQQVLVRGLSQRGGAELTLAHHLPVPGSFYECQISARASSFWGPQVLGWGQERGPRNVHFFLQDTVRVGYLSSLLSFNLRTIKSISFASVYLALTHSRCLKDTYSLNE